MNDKEFLRDLEQVLFFYGFQECVKNKNLNYMKIDENNYLLFKIFGNHSADLIHARYKSSENPCTSKPISEMSIVLSFYPKEHGHILKSYIEDLKSK